MKSYEKGESIISIIGGIVSAVSSALYLERNYDINTGGMIVFTILAFVTGASIVLCTMDSITDESGAIVIGILLVLVMPIISIVVSYGCVFIYAIVKFIVKIFGKFGWSTFGIILAIPIAIFFWLLHEIFG